MTDTLKDRIKACQNGSYKKAAATLLRKEIKASSRFINDKKVSDHHAIIPTEQYASLTSFSSDERKIYDMVVARFLAVLSAPAISEQLSVKANINGELFRAKAENIKQLGWRELYEEETQTKDTIKAGNIPVKGKEYPVGTISMTEGITNPPGRYTEGTLIDQMDKKGLGTVATRADIIDKLFNSYLLEKKGNEMGISIKVETNGSGGVKNRLTAKEIEECDGIIVAADKNVETARFDGKTVLFTKVATNRKSLSIK